MNEGLKLFDRSLCPVNSYPSLSLPLISWNTQIISNQLEQASISSKMISTTLLSILCIYAASIQVVAHPTGNVVFRRIEDSAGEEAADPKLQATASVNTTITPISGEDSPSFGKCKPR
jgi:hypothetical protein